MKIQLENPNRKKVSVKVKLIIAAIVVGISIFAALYAVNTNYRGLGGNQKIVEIEVIHKDGTSKDFKYRTDKNSLGEVLSGSGMAKLEEKEGVHIVAEADGEKADASKGEFWSVTKGGELIDDVNKAEIADKDKYILMFTVA